MAGYRRGVSFGCEDLEKRVSVRYKLPDGMATDVVGVLEFCDEAQIGVRNRRGALIFVAAGDVIAGKVVPSPAWREE